MSVNIWMFKLTTGAVMIAHVVEWHDTEVYVVNPMRVVKSEFGITAEVRWMEDWQIFDSSKIVHLQRSGVVYCAPATGSALDSYHRDGLDKVYDFMGKYND